jgi:hypothetical protein
MGVIKFLRSGAASVFVGVGLVASAHTAFAVRTFTSLTISPPATNIAAGATATVMATITAGPNSGSGEYGQITNTVSILSAEPTMTAGIVPNLCTVNAAASSNLTVTVNTMPGTPANTYTAMVVVAAAPGNIKAGTPITNTFTVTVTSGAADAFSMSISPTSENVFKGVATIVSATVNFVDRSATISGTVTNGVTVSPAGEGVTAGLNSIYAPITNNFGQTNLVLTVSADANATPGTYQIVVSGTNRNFTANSPIAGVASVTNTFILTDLNSFSMSISPASENVLKGMATNVSATVTLTDNSPVLSGVLTNGVTASPLGQGVTASLDNTLVSVNSGGGQATLTLTVSVAANATPGTYQVIVGATNSNFMANGPVPGLALVTNTCVVATPPASPSIQSFNLSGTTLTISGTSGTADAQYVVLASTNLTLPLAQWTPVFTNAFDASGNFASSLGLTNTLSAGAGQQFFILLQRTNLLTGVATPTFNPPAAPYYAETPVTITSATSGATIRYTTDGSTPTATHGTLYTGPVTMRQAVNTNMTGFVTNCSGVTMLKAVAYESGMAESAVFTGNYIIIVPLRYSLTSSLVLGLAHMAYNVSSQNWNSVLSLWTTYLGYDTVVVSNGFALIKINDQQYLELYQRPIVAPQYQLANFGFYVSDAEAFRQQLAQAGVQVPTNCTVNALGNLSFFTTDPDGHADEWVQYLPGSVTSQSLGQHMPGTQLFGYLEDYGDCTADVTAADNFYNQCGFSGTGTKVYLPNGNCYLEMLTYSTLTQTVAGKHEKAQLVTFRGMDLLAALDILQARDPSIPQTRSTEGGGSFPTHNCGDVYNADLSRVRMIDINY